ncbi:MAG: hypothetical protein NTZ65_00085 [Candidatus Berkelbacteria bacterium]|nr:hypothetical protein [Candidatus Berkelbacteria bacterium]
MRKSVHHHAVGGIMAAVGFFLALTGVIAFQSVSADSAAVSSVADWSTILITGGLVLVIGGLLLMIFLFMIDY